MLPDYYATLGVSPNSGRAVIRAAYVALMRRYHPDKNPSAVAAARVRAITTAYAVLGARDKRARYDLQRSQVGVANAPIFAPSRPQWQRWLPVPVGIAVIFLLVQFLLPPPLVPVDRASHSAPIRAGLAAASQEPSDVTAPSNIDVAAPLNIGALCTSAAASSLLKRELFRRAARLRGSDVAAFERLSSYSLLRFAAPMSASTNHTSGLVSCNASVALDLPPGLAAYGERRRLTGAIAYSLHPTNDRKNQISLTSDSWIVELLATLSRISAQPARVADTPQADPRLPVEQPPLVNWAPPPPGQPDARVKTQIEPRRAASQQTPSFSCRFAKSWAAISVCNSGTLAALDREMASLYGDSMAQADASTQAQLIRSDGRFLARRDGCTSEACVHSAYLAGIREIRNITRNR